MKICISSKGEKLESELEVRFGRSPYFIIYDTETLAFEAIKNQNIDAPSGAGIQSAQMIADKNISVLLTGNNPGPKATRVLEMTNIEIVTNLSGSVKDAIDKYTNSNLNFKEAEVSGFNQNKRPVRFGRGGCGRNGISDMPDYCICPECGEKVKHELGVPCTEVSCPKCSTRMVRG